MVPLFLLSRLREWVCVEWRGNDKGKKEEQEDGERWCDGDRTEGEWATPPRRDLSVEKRGSGD